MKIRRRKNVKMKKPDLLGMPKHERVKLIRKIRTMIRKKMSEARFWQSMLEVDSLTLNGQTVLDET